MKNKLEEAEKATENSSIIDMKKSQDLLLAKIEENGKKQDLILSKLEENGKTTENSSIMSQIWNTVKLQLNYSQWPDLVKEDTEEIIENIQNTSTEENIPRRNKKRTHLPTTLGWVMLFMAF